jgi:hypothetical protein
MEELYLKLVLDLLKCKYGVADLNQFGDTNEPQCTTSEEDEDEDEDKQENPAVRPSLQDAVNKVELSKTDRRGYINYLLMWYLHGKLDMSDIDIEFLTNLKNSDELWGGCVRANKCETLLLNVMRKLKIDTSSVVFTYQNQTPPAIELK